MVDKRSGKWFIQDNLVDKAFTKDFDGWLEYKMIDLRFLTSWKLGRQSKKIMFWLKKTKKTWELV